MQKLQLGFADTPSAIKIKAPLGWGFLSAKIEDNVDCCVYADWFAV